MGYYYTSSPENAVPGKSWVPPKTHTPGSRLEKRGARYYFPEMGHFTSKDPFGDLFGGRPYEFCGNEPLSEYDILGLMPWRVWLDLKLQPDSARTFFDNWLAQHPGLTDEQIGAVYDVFKRGCIGITEIELGIKGNPPLNNCYGSLQQAINKQKDMVKNCECKNFKNAYENASQPRVFSFQFHTGSPENWTPDDTRGGKVDFELGFIDTRRAPTAFDTPFNFGFYDPTTGIFTYANHSQTVDVMRSKRLPSGFDVTVYCVACENWKFGPYSQSPTSIKKPNIPIERGGKRKSWLL